MLSSQLQDFNCGMILIDINIINIFIKMTFYQLTSHDIIREILKSMEHENTIVKFISSWQMPPHFPTNFGVVLKIIWCR